jgi:hypothetical protein
MKTALSDSVYNVVVSSAYAFVHNDLQRAVRGTVDVAVYDFVFITICDSVYASAYASVCDAVRGSIYNYIKSNK